VTFGLAIPRAASALRRRIDLVLFTRVRASSHPALYGLAAALQHRLATSNYLAAKTTHLGATRHGNIRNSLRLVHRLPGHFTKSLKAPEHLRRRKLVSARHGGPTATGLFEILEPWKRDR
jgi:hypothetical protein